MVAWDAGLLPDAAMEVHHDNEQRDDNRLSNLVILSKANHAHHHAAPGSIVRNQHGEGIAGQGIALVAAKKKEALGPRACSECGVDISDRRSDATMCGQTCRMQKFKRRQPG